MGLQLKELLTSLVPRLGRPARMLWCPTHVRLRCEEIPAIIAAGFEVIPSKGSMEAVPYESHYDDESHPIYPDWRKYCTLPANVVEILRRIVINVRYQTVPLREEIDLVNRYIDVVYVSSFPEAVIGLRSWYNGAIVFRDFGRTGHGESHSQFIRRMELDFEPVKFKGLRYFYAPIFPTLLDVEDGTVVHNPIVIPPFISHGIQQRWTPNWEEPIVSCNVKLYECVEAGRPTNLRKADLVRAVGAASCVILGKNQITPETTSGLPSNFEVTGFIEDSMYYEHIARSLAFIYHGDNEHHMHYTPLEAMHIGVPVIFLSKTPMGRAIVHKLAHNRLEMRKVGAFENFDEMREALGELLGNPSQLRQLARHQKEVIAPVYSQERVVECFSTIRKRLRLPGSNTHVITRRALSRPVWFKKTQPAVEVGPQILAPHTFLWNEEVSGCKATRKKNEDMSWEFSEPSSGTFAGRIVAATSGKCTFAVSVSVEGNDETSSISIIIAMWKDDYVELHNHTLSAYKGEKSTQRFSVTFPSDATVFEFRLLRNHSVKKVVLHSFCFTGIQCGVAS